MRERISPALVVVISLGAAMNGAAADSILVGFDSGTPARVKQIGPPFNSGSSPIRDFYPFGMAFTGGVRVAMGDVNGDGTPDLVCAAGPGGAMVSIYSGVDGSLLQSLPGFNAAYVDGMFVAAGDVDGDGYADIIVGSESGSPAYVNVISGRTYTMITGFAPFGTFAGGVRVAAGDVNGDGYADIIAAQGSGGTNHVKIFSGVDQSLLDEFDAYGSPFSGVYVASADVNGDGVDDIVTGPGPGATNMRVFLAGSHTPIIDFNPYSISPSYTGGVRVGGGSLDSNGIGDDVAGVGPGAAPIVFGYDGGNSGLPKLANFAAFGPGQTFGIFVAASPICRPMARVTGDATMCAGQSTDLSIALTGVGPWSLMWSDGFPQMVTTSPALRSVSPTATTTYTVSSISDTKCDGRAYGSALVTVTPDSMEPSVTAPVPATLTQSVCQ